MKKHLTLILVTLFICTVMVSALAGCTPTQEPDSVSYLITYLSGRADIPAPAPAMVAEGGLPTLPTLSAHDQTFLGWAVTTDGVTPDYMWTGAVYAPVTLLGVWEDIEGYYTHDNRVNISHPQFDRDAYLDSYQDTIRADEYRDIRKVGFDLSYHTDLADQGMRWVVLNEDGTDIYEVPCYDHEAMDALVENGTIDPSRPTVVFIHGIQMDSYDGPIYFLAGNDVFKADDPDYDGYIVRRRVQQSLLWLKNGYNVINFQYFRFADEPVALNANLIGPDGTDYGKTIFAANQLIESKVWSTEGVMGMRYRLKSGFFNDGTNLTGVLDPNQPTFTDPDYAIDFSLAEYMAAEWVRLMDYLTVKGIRLTQSEVRLTGHSMGCEVTTAGTYLLTELVRTGQIPAHYIPQRICLQDGYMGAYLGEELRYGGDLKSMASLATVVANITCSWTGKLINRGGSSPLIVCCARALVNQGLAVEFYTDEGGFVCPISTDMGKLYYSMVAHVYFNGSFGTMGTGTHNSVREIYTAGILFDVPPVVDAMGNPTGEKALSARSSTADVLARMGKEYRMVAGASTGTPRDDCFQRIK